MITSDEERKIYIQMIYDMADRLTTPIHGQSWIINHHFQQAKNKIKNKGDEQIMKVMISQPMNGIPDEKIKQIQNDLKEKFAKYHIEVVDSFLTEEADTTLRNKGVFYLGRTLMNFLSDVDAVYFVDGWQSARGCRIERKICEEYDIMILDNSFFNKQTITNSEIKFRPFLTKTDTSKSTISPYKDEATWEGVEKSFGPEVGTHISYID